MYAPGAILLTIAYLTANRSLVFIIVIHILNNVLGFVL
ncbi:CAAX protease [Enterococcus faecium]|nr:CAAX protease [Enterococcus faecium]